MSVITIHRNSLLRTTVLSHWNTEIMFGNSHSKIKCNYDFLYLCLRKSPYVAVVLSVILAWTF